MTATMDASDRPDGPVASHSPAGASDREGPEGGGPSPVDVGTVQGDGIVFPTWRGDADPPSPRPAAPLPPDERVGFAVVGLGRLSLEEILPAFGSCEKARLAALVSGTPTKLATVARQYGIPAERCFSYAEFDRIAADRSIQAVYIVLPNALHRGFTERAAAAGKHVLTEKPMSVSAADAQAMVDACAAAGVSLMVAYRIHYEPYNRRARQMVRDGDLGRLVAISATNMQTVAPDGAEQWRHRRALAGGGALVDVGIYCLNTARYLVGEEPVEVSATSHSPAGDPRFAEVEETVAFTLRFPGGQIAQCLTSYGGREDKRQRLNGAQAIIEMPNAYRYSGQRLVITRREGDVTAHTELEIPHANQFAAEIDHMAQCILDGTILDTPGEEGVRDHRIMDAIYDSARSNRPVALAIDHAAPPPRIPASPISA